MLLWCLLGGSVSLRAAEETPPLGLFDFKQGFEVAAVETRDARVSLVSRGDRSALRIETGHTDRFPGITLKAPNGKWNLSDREYVSVDLRNAGDEPVTVSCRVDSPGGDGTKNSLTERVVLAPKAAETLTVRLYPTPLQLSERVELIGMRRGPAEPSQIDPSNVTRLWIFVPGSRTDRAFEVANIRAGGHVATMDAKTFFPFIDEFGQFIHKEWPGKTHSVEELLAHGKAEENDLTAHPGPPDRDPYGGWTGGPKLKATGFFRVEKHEGKWWLVDPEGRLFWSHGVDCVRMRESTAITDREKYFRDLPKSDSPLAQFYGMGRSAAHGYYQNIGQYRTYDFSQANLLRKYGPDWRKQSAEIAHRRLKSWGMNTIANWSDSAVYLMRKTPYTATVGGGGRRLEGSEGYWGKFQDVFDPVFRQSLRARLAAEKDASVGDPWCIGFFVHNELSWGDEVSLAVATLISPADQPAKKVFVEDLKAKYGTIEKLNAAWGTDHASWEALLQSQKAPDKKKAWDDLAAFYTKTAETYFRTIRDEIKEVAPNQLYLGCRFAWVNDRAARAAAKFCDIVSYNRYTYSVKEQRLPDGIDMPIIIGEFHFGALDRGMFHPGLKITANQAVRAATYNRYVRGALENPYIVGAHWFQYKDQPTTGRSDGENYQIGFVDICDTPYLETISACREVGYSLYDYRLKNK
jgi:hypothetical protein